MLCFDRLHWLFLSQVKLAGHLGGDRGAHTTGSLAKPDIVPQWIFEGNATCYCHLQPGAPPVQTVQQAIEPAGGGNLPGPLSQQLPAHGSEPHPFGEALAIHLPPQYPQLDQPDPIGFSPIRSEISPAEAAGVVPAAEPGAAQGPDADLVVEGPPEGKAAQG